MSAVVVRWARVDDADTDAPFLTDAERGRLTAMREEADRRRFVAARTLLRATVVEVAGCAPSAIGMRQVCARCGGPHGRPIVEVGGRALEVSLSHAGALAIV